MHSIVGFEKAVITQPGYAIEYDYFRSARFEADARGRNTSSGLYFAGQINGTTGYEEAGAQGLLAGVNAARRAQDKDEWFPQRHEAYIGVLIDDLITRGVSEPYRMFTSRAEYRLMLREDNADLRLTPVGRELGLVNDERWTAFNKKREAVAAEQARLKDIYVRDAGVDALALLKRPESDYSNVVAREEVGRSEMAELSTDEQREQVEFQVQVQAKYQGYIDRQEREIAKHAKQEALRLPEDIDYETVDGLSNEARQKLSAARPATLGQASRLEGMTPSAVSLLLIHIKKAAAEEKRLGGTTFTSECLVPNGRPVKALRPEPRPEQRKVARVKRAVLQIARKDEELLRCIVLAQQFACFVVATERAEHQPASRRWVRPLFVNGVGVCVPALSAGLAYLHDQTTVRINRAQVCRHRSYRRRVRARRHQEKRDVPGSRTAPACPLRGHQSRQEGLRSCRPFFSGRSGEPRK